MSTELAIGGRRFRLIQLAGVGASSRVWQLEDAEQRFWALKVGNSRGQALRLAREAERIMWLASPHLARVVDAGSLEQTWELPAGSSSPTQLEAGAPYLLMEWCPGRSLCDDEEQPGDRVLRAYSILGDLARALVDLHAAGVAHGDIKPANIIVNDRAERATARLVDLGMGDTAERHTPLSGTPRYLAPEVFNPQLSGDGRARDLYALALSVAEWFAPELRTEPELVRAIQNYPWPEPLARLLLPLVQERPRARPSAAWLVRSVDGLAPRETDASEQYAHRLLRLRSSYLAVRRTEWSRAARHAHADIEVEGEPGVWLAETLSLARKLVLLRQTSLTDGPLHLAELDAVQRVRWLTRLTGATAAHWPAPHCASDAELAKRLAGALEQVEPAGLTLRHLAVGPGLSDAAPSEPLDVALALNEVGAPPAVLDAAERLVEQGAGSSQLALALARALRLRGELGRAVVLLSRLGTVDASLELAELWRRIGDSTQALAVLSDLPSGAFTRTQLARACALKARVALDRGDAERSLEILTDAPEAAIVLEARALSELASGRLEAARQTLERAKVYASSDEERARIAGAEGMLHHALGDAGRAQRCFEAASEHAQRASAVLEEATYLTGVAAAATDRGSFGVALEAAERATLLFEHLGRARDAARAVLARAAVYSSLGLSLETEQAVRETLVRARAASDVVCSGYAHLAMADVLLSTGGDASEHAERAAQLLRDSTDADRTRAAARCLAAGLTLDIARFDGIAKIGNLAPEARLEWWGARALHSMEHGSGAGGLIVTELEGLAGEKAPAAVKGRALAAGVTLALALGNTEAARRLTAGVAEAVRSLKGQVPQHLLGAVEELNWVSLAQTPDSSGLLPEQLLDVERLVRALGRRDRLRPLLDQVLDALVLWTGVERGLLLLRAPGNKLVPRAARNLARADLVGEQLRLSHSLAERALAQRQPVVAVDAVGELSETHASVHALKLRSVLAVPLMARGEAMGVVYLDDRQRRGAFGSRELAWVKLVATLAAVAIADARDQLLLRRAARRAERAEAKLTERLARREVELEVAERALAKTRGARETRYAYEAIVGESPALCRMLSLVDRVTVSDISLLLVGESGVGKELIARAIHANGPRAERPFVGENCAAIPEGLLESTLFGHVRGAFTGAERPRAGLFEAASGGTLFLDEIGEMSLSMQSKLLRVLQDGEVRPVGSERARQVDVRVIAATHRDLHKMVREGRFREDLFYRLNVIAISIPPLRERVGDVERLINHFIKVHAPGRQVAISPDALAALRAYSWPGNVRQLENEVRRFLVVADAEVERSHLSPDLAGQPHGTVAQELGLNVRRHVDALETELVRTALDQTGGNQTRAAELLGLSRFGLQKMMKRLEIAPRRPALRRVASELSDAE